MGRTPVLLVAVLIVASMGIVPQAVAADEWNKCHSTKFVDTDGTYSGVMDSPGDEDAIKFRLEKGDFVSVSVSKPEGAPGSLVVSNTGEERGVGGILRDISGGEEFGSTSVVDIFSSASWEYHAENDGPYCIEVGSRDWEEPYEWKISLSKNNPEPTSFEATELQDRVNSLESQLENKNEKINKLNSLLEQKNQTIDELESRIKELESQSSGGSEGDVTIDVTVTPANGQQNFVEGSEAVVQAESENADVSEIQVEYGAGTYQLDSSGEVAIPLAETGTQEMAVVYGDTTEQVSIEVQSQDGQNQQNQQSSGGTGASGPGFGVVVAVIALFGVGFLSARYR